MFRGQNGGITYHKRVHEITERENDERTGSLLTDKMERSCGSLPEILQPAARWSEIRLYRRFEADLWPLMLKIFRKQRNLRFLEK